MKKVVCVLIAVVSSFVVSSTVFADLNSGLKAYYPFNGNANDESGNGNQGTVYGAALTEDRFGNTRSAYNFDGVNDYIKIPYVEMIEPSIFTLSVWLKTTGNSWHTLWTSDPDSYYCSHGFEMSIYNGKGSANIDPTRFCRDGSTIYSNNLLNDGRWHHMVFLYDGSMSLFIDGILQDHTMSSPYTKTQAPVHIGMTYNSGDQGQRYFPGAIDDIRLYDRILSESEINMLYIAGTPASSVP